MRTRTVTGLKIRNKWELTYKIELYPLFDNMIKNINLTLTDISNKSGASLSTVSKYYTLWLNERYNSNTAT